MTTNAQISGLILAYILDGHGGGKEVDWQEIETWEVSQGVLCLYLDYERYDARNWLLNESGLPRAITDQLLDPEARPRCEMHKEGLLMVLRGISPELDTNPKTTISLRMWVDAGRIIITRMRRILSGLQLRYALNDGTGPSDQADLVLMAVERINAIICETVNRMRDTVDDLEDEMDHGNYQSMRQRLLVVRRTAIVLQRFLEPQRTAINQMRHSRLTWLSEDDVTQLALLSDNMATYIKDVEAIRDRATIVSEELANQLSVDLNRRMYVLSILSVIFLPLGFITGLLGVNLGGIPGEGNPIGFAVLVVIIIILVTIQLLLIRWRRWL